MNKVYTDYKHTSCNYYKRYICMIYSDEFDVKILAQSNNLEAILEWVKENNIKTEALKEIKYYKRLGIQSEFGIYDNEDDDEYLIKVY